MATPTLATGSRGFTFGRNLPLLNQRASVGFEIASTASADVVAALASASDPFPARDIELAEIRLQSLGTRVFLDASRAIDPARATQMGEASALLNLGFLKPEAPFDAAALLAAGHVPPDQLAFADRVVSIAP